MALTTPRARRLTQGEIMCLKLLLHNIDEALSEATSAKTLVLTRDAIKVAAINTQIARDLVGMGAS